jgi:hypothetical protein
LAKRKGFATNGKNEVVSPPVRAWAAGRTLQVMSEREAHKF